ncbi:MAG TPA: DUF6502 family protein [Gammaproteobacteria bacterium]|nr:DUF6502 family protein [Gammaproteobacteria bacterium]
MVEDKIRQAAFSAFTVLMRPLARILLRCGVTWKELAELLKGVYVDVATQDYGKRGRPANASRVAILTGLSRRDVKRARDRLGRGAPDGLAPLAKINHASRVLSGWFQDPEFVDAKGKPRLLERTGERGFEGLVKRFAQDIPSTAMLKELVAVGAVAVTPQGRLRVKMRYYSPAAPDDEAVLRSGAVIADLGTTVAENLFRVEPRTRFEGRATNARVARAARRAFREYVEARGMQFLEDIDGWLSRHESSSPDDEVVRLGIGLYQIQDDGEQK